MSIVAGLMDEELKMPLGTEVDLGPGYIVLEGDAASPPAKEAQQPPSCRPMSIVATSLISATAELLFPMLVSGRLLYNLYACLRV